MSAGHDAAFPSLSALQTANLALLKRHRDVGDAPDVIAEIRAFMDAGIRTGAYLDSDADRWAAQSILDYWSTTLHRSTDELVDATLAGFDPELAPTLDDALCPYLGLNAFSGQQHDRYFGRQQLVTQLVTRLRAQRLLAVLGPSGSGKSSLVSAGVVPALQHGALAGQPRWSVYPPLVPGAEPLEHLARLVLPRGADASAAKAEAQRLRTRPTHLAERLAEAGTDPALIVVDQFEELFTLCNDDAARVAFVDNLLAVTQAAGARHTVILTLRIDFREAVQRLPRLAAAFGQAEVLVTPLTAAELREAIDGPAARIGLKFEDGLVDKLVDDVVGEPAGLPLLQFTLLKLWESRDHNRITWDAYRELGGGRLSLARSADRVWHDLGLPENQRAGQRILLELVRPTEGQEFTSKRVRRRRLYQLGVPAERITLALSRLIDAHLLRVTPGETADDDRIEVAHEALVRNWPNLVAWLDEERVRLRHRIALTHKAEEWEARGRDENLLLSGEPLDEAARYEELGELESAFVQASLRQRAWRQRRRRLMTRSLIGLSAALVLALAGGTIVSFRFWRQTLQVNAQLQVKRDSLEQALRLLGRQSDSLVLSNEETRTAMARASAEAGRANAAVAATAGGERTRQAEGRVRLALYGMESRPSARLLRTFVRAFGEWGAPLAFKPHGAWVNGADYSPDGTMLATAGADSTVRLWNARTGHPLRALVGHTAGIWDVRFDATGRRLASAGPDRTARIWDVATGQTLAVLRGHRGSIADVTFSRDGALVATAGRDSTLRIWDAATGRLLATRAVRGWVWSVEFSPRAPELASVGDSLLIWDIQDPTAPTIARRAKGHAGSAVIRSVDYRDDGLRLVTAGSDSVILVWPESLGRPLLTMSGHTGRGIYDVRFSADGALLASAGDDDALRIWNAVTGAQVRAFTGAFGTMLSVAFAPADSQIAAASDDGFIRIWDLPPEPRLLRRLAGATPGRLSVAHSQDGRRVVSGNHLGGITVWDSAGNAVRTFQHSAEDSVVRSVSISPNGAVLASASRGVVRVWDIETGALLWTGERERGDSVAPDIWTTAISPDNQLLAVGGIDSTVGLFRLSDGRRLARLPRRHTAYSLAFDPRDARRLVSAGRGDVRIWRLNAAGDSARQIDSLSGHTGLVMGLAFDSRGRRLVSTDGRGAPRLWDFAGGTPRATILDGQDTSWAWGAAFSRDDAWIVTSHWDGTLRQWDPNTAALVRTVKVTGLDTLHMRLSGISAGPDAVAVTANHQGYVRLYSMPPLPSADSLVRISRRRLSAGLDEDECRVMDLEGCTLSSLTPFLEARQRAAAGDAAGARAALARAQRVDPSVTAAELIDPGLARHYVQRALDSAHANRRTSAIAAFRRAKALTPGMTLSPEREVDAAIAAYQRIALETALRAARDHAANDRMDSARVVYQSLRGREARPAAAAAGYWASVAALRAQTGMLDSALALLARADSIDRSEVQADHLNYLCWFGSLYNRAADVADACERAVALKPSPYIVDSRGLARALVGNLAGAIEDFAVYSAAFADTSTNQEVRQRRDWLARLQAGEAATTIFTPEILAALRN